MNTPDQPRRRFRSEPAWVPWLFLSPFIITITVFLAWPLLQSVLLSMQQTYGPKTSRWVGIDNFTFLLTDPLFWKALRNTLIFSCGSVFLQLPLSLGLALLLNRPGLKGRAFFRLIFFAPSLVGLVFVGLMFALMFEKRTGIINVTLHALFASFNPEFPWLQEYVMPALILAALWLYVGFNMIYFLAALQNVPAELLEAAALDGAGPWDRFRHVVVPEIMPVVSFVVLLSLLGSFQLFELPFILLNGPGPDNRGLTIVMYLYQTGFVTGDLGYASAIGWMLALMLGTFALGQRLWMKKEEAK
ncbi:carbohydrate ABC transporter permease [Rariglobus hedericola]|uniref:Sugar ABC transporter permease n=1 Tax=Rariglobus hedericola TaxID=2597822 RepID=A0A556QS43_9BACT|nr:sugar ABC transporter permease [Rariglobus hedericola]TSJ79458.1 sugar ABC transporter permease [Rariglobus hedericola]